MPVSSRKVWDSRPIDWVVLVFVKTMRSFPRYIDELFRPFPASSNPELSQNMAYHGRKKDTHANKQKTASCGIIVTPAQPIILQEALDRLGHRVGCASSQH